MASRPRAASLVKGSRAYLSGPMDFVASREDEMKHGWRSRISTVLADLGVTVFDPWHKPDVGGLGAYGREGLNTADKRAEWDFGMSRAALKARARCSANFWQTLHIDLRMVDTSDFIVAYCPTNVYSVGTPHEVALCRQQHKPVLFVSPSVTFPSLRALRKHLASDAKGLALLDALAQEVPIKENEEGIPSLWYMPLVGPESFFDGFGFEPYRKQYAWNRETAIDRQEKRRKPKRPLMPFLMSLKRGLPKKWDSSGQRFIPNDDWLLWQLETPSK